MSKTCLECNTVCEINVSPEQLARLEAGELIQRAMPEVSEGDRELLISGICGKCFDFLFSDEESSEECMGEE
jgi:hypothetical protein